MREAIAKTRFKSEQFAIGFLQGTEPVLPAHGVRIEIQLGASDARRRDKALTRLAERVSHATAGHIQVPRWISRHFKILVVEHRRPANVLIDWQGSF